MWYRFQGERVCDTQELVKFKKSYGDLLQALKSAITAFFQENNVIGALATLKISTLYCVLFLCCISINICSLFNFLGKPPLAILTGENYWRNSMQGFVQIGSELLLIIVYTTNERFIIP